MTTTATGGTFFVQIMALDTIPVCPLFTKSFYFTRGFFVTHVTDANLVRLVAMVIECHPFSKFDHI
jgi:hypothetical protein